MKHGELAVLSILCGVCVASIATLFGATEGLVAINQPWGSCLWVFAGLIVGAMLVYVCWRIPSLAIRDLDVKKNMEVTAQNELRKTLVQAAGGILVIVGLYFSWKTLETTRLQNHQTARSTIDAQITERFTKAIDQLGALADKKKNLPVRVRAWQRSRRNSANGVVRPGRARHKVERAAEVGNAAPARNRA